MDFKKTTAQQKLLLLLFILCSPFVPVLAVAFGIAKGFGFQESLEAEISQRFIEQKEVVDKLTFLIKHFKIHKAV